MDSESSRFFRWISDTESDEPQNDIEEFLLRLAKVLTNLVTAVAVAVLVGAILYGLLFVVLRSIDEAVGVRDGAVRYSFQILVALVAVTLAATNKLLPLVRFARRYQIITFIGLFGVVRALLANVNLISVVASTGSFDAIGRLIVGFLSALFLGESSTPPY